MLKTSEPSPLILPLNLLKLALYVKCVYSLTFAVAVVSVLPSSSKVSYNEYSSSARFCK